MNWIDSAQLARLFRGADQDMSARIDRATLAVNEAAHPAHVTAHFALDEGRRLGGLTLEGESIRCHLEGCREVVVGVCTLGSEIDRLLERLQLSDLALAYLVDLAAGLAVDNLAEATWRDVCRNGETAGLRVTTRFSCGYGDFPLSQQGDILRLSGADRTLRIQVNAGGMMYPTKTITYLAGLGPAQPSD